MNDSTSAHGAGAGGDRTTGTGAPAPDAVGELVCSARGCRHVATWGVLWNNPKLHTPDRRKVWLACDEHREHLSEYLRVRGFLRDVVPVDELDRAAP